MWALTPQTSRPRRSRRWDTCYWSAEWQREFIADYLGPAMVEAGLLDVDDLDAGVGIFAFDHNKADILDFVPVVLDDPNAARYVRGIALHWYAINLGEVADYRGEALAELGGAIRTAAAAHRVEHRSAPGRPRRAVLGPGKPGLDPRQVHAVSQYAVDIITDLNNGAVGYIEWCMVLSDRGGPNPYDTSTARPCWWIP